MAERTPETRHRLRLVQGSELSESQESLGRESVSSRDAAAADAEESAQDDSRAYDSAPSQPRMDVELQSSPRSVLSSPGTGPTAAELSEREDAELVALARAGQSAAFEALYRRHSSYALALAVRVQGNATDIEDIVHDSFLRVHDRLDDLRTDSSFRGWLSSVVVSLVRTRLRRRKMLGILGLSTADPIDLDALVSPQAGPEVRAQLAQVYAVLREVSVDQSICWTLRYVEGRKLEDVAAIAGCSLATAKRRIAAVQERILLSESHRVSEEAGS